jgi:hypothetical protein
VFLQVFQMYVSSVSSVFQTYVASVASECFVSRSDVAYGMHVVSGRGHKKLVRAWECWHGRGVQACTGNEPTRSTVPSDELVSN